MNDQNIHPKNLLQKLHYKVMLVGVVMGAVDIVPGVSGGTVAFILGIYEQLLLSIRRVLQGCLPVLFKKGFKAYWQYINGWFLLSLILGISISAFLFSKLILWMLNHYPITLWSFFIGLVIGSCIHLRNEITLTPIPLISLCLGILIALLLTQSSLIQVKFTPSLIHYFFAGTIAICAMILPGISGSFILVLLGVYPYLLKAITSLNISILLLFMTGCLVGILLFSHLLHYLLKHARQSTMNFLVGLMLGALPILWPWKMTMHDQQNNISPHQFSLLYGTSNHLFIACLMVALGISIMLIFDWFEKK